MAIPGIRRLIVASILCGVLVPAVLASGAEITRDEFVERGNAICRQEGRTVDRLFSRFARLVNQGNFAAAGRALARIGRTELRALARLAEIPRPSQIAAKVERALNNARAGSRLLIRAGRNLARERVRKTLRLLRRADRNFKVANRLFRQLGLQACAYM